MRWDQSAWLSVRSHPENSVAKVNNNCADKLMDICKDNCDLFLWPASRIIMNTNGLQVDAQEIRNHTSLAAICS